MEKFGFTEKEARVSMLLEDAEELLFELYESDAESDEGGSRLADIIWRETHVRQLFADLHRRLAVRVLIRDYPEGWGGVAPGDDEEKDRG